MSKDCTTCKLAEWKTNIDGRRSPGGFGRCTWQAPTFAVPQSIDFTMGPGRMPEFFRRPIHRATPFLNCAAWDALPAPEPYSPKTKRGRRYKA